MNMQKPTSTDSNDSLSHSPKAIPVKVQYTVYYKLDPVLGPTDLIKYFPSSSTPKKN